jgi:protein-S-isoprenylcysteine O-methyltransferase Ste14
VKKRSRSNLRFHLLLAIVILPGTMVGGVPAAIIWFSRHTPAAVSLTGPLDPVFWAALSCAALGAALGVQTVRLFVRKGNGTPAPWHPPRRLVVEGPYRYVRNPMITGVVLCLIAESLILRSWPLAVWAVVFFIGNAVYFPLVEEKSLERRFGQEYREYRRHVPRWIPRLRPWTQ